MGPSLSGLPGSGSSTCVAGSSLVGTVSVCVSGSIDVDTTGSSAVESASTAVLAANQGLYNGFLAVGLLWGLVTKQRDIVLFFLLCVIGAGIFGAVTASFTILYVQALPALIALVFTLLSRRRFG